MYILRFNHPATKTPLALIYACIGIDIWYAKSKYLNQKLASLGPHPACPTERTWVTAEYSRSFIFVWWWSGLVSCWPPQVAKRLKRSQLFYGLHRLLTPSALLVLSWTHTSLLLQLRDIGDSVKDNRGWGLSICKLSQDLISILAKSLAHIWHLFINYFHQ